MRREVHTQTDVEAVSRGECEELVQSVLQQVSVQMEPFSALHDRLARVEDLSQDTKPRDILKASSCSSLVDVMSAPSTNAQTTDAAPPFAKCARDVEHQEDFHPHAHLEKQCLGLKD